MGVFAELTTHYIYQLKIWFSYHLFVMKWNMWTLFWTLVVFNLREIATQQISGYGPVDVAELNPLTLSWNQVHFLVRENILAIDELRDIHDKIYEEIHECFGLERCRKQENFIDGPPPHGQDLKAGALLSTLRNARLGLEGQQSVLEQSIRQAQNFDQRNSFQNSRTQQGSSSSSSYSSSSSTVKHTSHRNSYFEQNKLGGSSPEYADYDYDQGPNPNRG